MRCVVLNRNYPPSAGITGYSAFELVEYLKQHGVEVHVVTTSGTYAGGVRCEVSIHSATIHGVRKIYDGKNKILRLLASLIEGRNLATKAVSLKIGPMIALTDPPLLNYWVAKSSLSARIPWIYWAMDIYPEAFAAAGLVKRASSLYRHFKRGSLASTPSHLIALGPNQRDYLQKDYSRLIPTSILPCGVDTIEQLAETPAWLPTDNKITFGYIGNLGQAHDPVFVESVIAALDPDQHHFILSVYGTHAARILKYVAKFKHVTILPEVSRTELGFIDIHLASLEPAWDHICVPSKAVSAVCSGSCLLLCATDQGDNWQLLKDAAWWIDPAGSMPTELARFMGSLTPAAVAEKRAKARAICRNLIKMRDAAFADILSAVRRLQKNPETQGATRHENPDLQ